MRCAGEGELYQSMNFLAKTIGNLESRLDSVLLGEQEQLNAQTKQPPKAAEKKIADRGGTLSTIFSFSSGDQLILSHNPQLKMAPLSSGPALLHHRYPEMQPQAEVRASYHWRRGLLQRQRGVLVQS